MHKSSCSRKKFITIMMILAVLLCSFLGVEYDMTENKVSLVQTVPDSSSLQKSPASMGDVAVHIIDNKNSVLDEYTSETAIARQLSTKRSGVNTLRGLYIVAFILWVLSLLFLTSIYLYPSSICCSQRYIIRYIHNKDGHKA